MHPAANKEDEIARLPAQQVQPSAEWSKLPLRDPVDGTICYLYLPISAPHSPVTSTGFVQYGPNVIGSINCMPGPPVAAPGRKP
jgi:hypothetical protein